MDCVGTWTLRVLTGPRMYSYMKPLGHFRVSQDEPEEPGFLERLSSLWVERLAGSLVGQMTLKKGLWPRYHITRL